MLSSRVRYALGALAYLARHPSQPRTTERIAAVTGAPLPTLAKILQTLSRAGMIRTLRGPRGGVRLICDASKVSALDIVNAIDSSPYRRMLRPDALGPCLYRRLDVLLRLAELVLRHTTIAELASGVPAQDDTPGAVSVDEILGRIFDEDGRPAAAGGAEETDRNANSHVQTQNVANVRRSAAGTRPTAARRRRRH